MKRMWENFCSLRYTRNQLDNLQNETELKIFYVKKNNFHVKSSAKIYSLTIFLSLSLVRSQDFCAFLNFPSLFFSIFFIFKTTPLKRRIENFLNELKETFNRSPLKWQLIIKRKKKTKQTWIIFFPQKEAARF